MSKRSRALASAVVAAVWRNPSRCSGLLGNTRNTGERVVTDEQALVTYQVAPVDTAALTVTHEEETPLDLEVVGFGGGGGA